MGGMHGVHSCARGGCALPLLRENPLDCRESAVSRSRLGRENVSGSPFAVLGGAPPPPEAGCPSPLGGRDMGSRPPGGGRLGEGGAGRLKSELGSLRRSRG